MMNSGCLIANTVLEEDVKVIEEKNRLLGVKNCVVMNVPPADMAKVINLLVIASELYRSL